MLEGIGGHFGGAVAILVGKCRPFWGWRPFLVGEISHFGGEGGSVILREAAILEGIGGHFGGAVAILVGGRQPFWGWQPL